MRRALLSSSLVFTTCVTLAGCGSSSVPTAQSSEVPGLGSHAESMVLLQEAEVTVETLRNSPVIVVESEDDAGFFTLRDAVGRAAASGSASVILFDRDIEEINLESPIVYTGTEPLLIDGGRNNVVIDATNSGGNGFEASGGGDLFLLRLTVENAAENGIRVDVPADQEEDVRVGLIQVTLQGNGEFGLLVEDQQNNSDAGINVTLSSSTIGGESTSLGNGFGVADRDGVRLNEGGLGDIQARITNTNVVNNGGDGVELDETGNGDVNLFISQSNFDANGPFDPSDLDDGLDIDEAGGGSIIATILRSSFSENFDQGLDLDEEGAGNIEVTLNAVEAGENKGENIKLSEENEGNIDVTFTNVEASNSEDEEGIVLEEAGMGDLIASVSNSTASGNDKEGIVLEERGMGNLNAEISNSETSSNHGNGLQLEEVGGGDLEAQLRRTESSSNDNDGVSFDEGGDGSLTAGLTGATVTSNGDDGIQVDQRGDGNCTLDIRFGTITIPGSSTGERINVINCSEVNEFPAP
jgi:hypothetical protein